MKTELGKALAVQLPHLIITEEVLPSGVYFVYVRFGDEMLAIESEKCGGQYGVSVLDNNSLGGFGGHDDVVDSIKDVVKWVTKRLPAGSQ